MGTLCITIAANIAKTAVLNFDACFPDSIVGFTSNEHVDSEYIRFWFSFIQKRLEEATPESAQKNINLEILRGLDIPQPPSDLQHEFTEIVLSQERLLLQQEKFGNELDVVSSSLQHRAFAGEL